jgi:hypothetical protein
VTNPPQGPSYPAGHDPSQGARPDHAAPTQRIAPPTERIPHRGTPQHDPTERIATTAAPRSRAAATPDKKKSMRRFAKDPLSIVLIVVIICALGLAALVGGELYARHKANSVVARVVECVVQDKVEASFGMLPPFLAQHLNGHYSSISIQTAGNQLRDAKGMKLNLDIKDVRMQESGDSAGTIGSLVAVVHWTADGIRQTVQNAIPLFGGIVSTVTTNASAGTVELDGPLGTVTAIPRVIAGGLALDVQRVTGLGFTLPRETVQPAMDVFTSRLTRDYPIGIKADSVQVTEDGVISQFSTQNATIPRDSQDPCFTGI